MSRTKLLVFFIFTISLSLRLVLSIINRQANDDHVEVVNWIVDKNEIPGKEDCWECFQPKAFYLISAGVISVLNIEYRHSRIICIQLINFIFSFITLLFLWKFINRQIFLQHIKLSCFALVALNPCLAGINVQATNDTLLILAGVMSIYFADLFFRTMKLRDGLWLIFFTILAALTKASGLVLMAALLVIFSIKVLLSDSEKRKSLIKNISIIMLIYFFVVPFAGSYYFNYKKYKNPFITNIRQKETPPSFFHRTYAGRPGVTSIVDTYFTFRYLDMIRQPYIINDGDGYPLHRTSLWSELYGRTFFMHFDQFPERWKSIDPEIIVVGRLLIALAIFPMFLFLAGIFNLITGFIKKMRLEKRNYFCNNTGWMNLVFVSAFLLFVAKYTYDYRDFSTMKSIFVFPALPAFMNLFMEGYSRIKSKMVINLFLIIIGIIILLSIYDISFLIWQFLK